MRTGKYIENNLGQPIGFEYENKYVFKGEFGQDKKPIWGDIFDPDGENIYHGQIIGDILVYFSEYQETGKIKQRPIL